MAEAAASHVTGGMSTSPTAAGASMIQSALGKGGVQGGPMKRNRRTERGAGKVLMMSQDASQGGSFLGAGPKDWQDVAGAQRAAGQRRGKQQPVKGFHGQNQSNEQRRGYHGRNANLIGSSYAFTGAAGSGVAGLHQGAGVNLQTLNKSEIYK